MPNIGKREAKLIRAIYSVQHVPADGQIAILFSTTLAHAQAQGYQRPKRLRHIKNALHGAKALWEAAFLMVYDLSKVDDELHHLRTLATVTLRHANWALPDQGFMSRDRCIEMDALLSPQEQKEVAAMDRLVELKSEEGDDEILARFANTPR